MIAWNIRLYELYKEMNKEKLFHLQLYHDLNLSKLNNQKIRSSFFLNFVYLIVEKY